jgi:hypothetical protein
VLGCGQTRSCPELHRGVYGALEASSSGVLTAPKQGTGRVTPVVTCERARALPRLHRRWRDLWLFCCVVSSWHRGSGGALLFEKGEVLDVKDVTGHVVWRPSVIAGVRTDAVHIHYMAWEAKWDEWIAKTSDRLAAFGSRLRAVATEASSLRRGRTPHTCAHAHACIRRCQLRDPASVCP